MRKTGYTLIDLLENDDFISFVHHSTKESHAYWNNLIKRGKIDRNDYELALCYIREMSVSKDLLTENEIKDMWLNIKIGNKKHIYNKRRRVYLLSSSIAASIFIAGILLFQQLVKTGNLSIGTANKMEIENVPKPDSTGDDILVLLSDNNQIAVKGNHTEIKYNDKGEAEINSQKTEMPKGKKTIDMSATYNQVIVPKGKFSSLILSDGTKLWLNAASRVVYPPVFEKTKRKIFIEGEAYMEVTTDEKRPFIVKTKQMEVKVLGTSFNINVCEEDESQTVVLVSGSVTIKTNNEEKPVETELYPNQLFNLRGDKIEVQNVNAKDYISWKEGYYIFKSETLSHILNRLSNYYGVAIDFDDIIGNMHYSGKIDLKEDIDRVLGGLSYTAPIDYQKKNDIYYLSFINKPLSPME